MRISDWSSDVCSSDLMADLLADDASMLRSFHAGIVAQGTPPPAAATYLAAWLPGALARAVGYALATTGAGFPLPGAAAGALGFPLHPAGWPLQLELSPSRRVASDERRAGKEGVGPVTSRG